MSGIRRRLRPLHKKWTGALCALAMASTVALSTSAANAEPAPSTDDPTIAAAVLATFERQPTADFWVRLGEHADTAPAASVADRTERGARVVDALRDTAERSQQPVRKLLDAKGLRYTPFWVTNAVLVRGATLKQAGELAVLPGVSELSLPRTYARAEPVKATPTGVAPAGVEWGLININASAAWEQGARGAGIVVANVDSGVRFDHPALVNSYRGNNGDGTFSHDYNWFDPSRSCADPSPAPCDNNGHGTHTMGTMVGDDGAGNQIGVAPAATWIAAKGCEDSGCTDTSLLAASQWILAPTDLNGQNADPSRRPHIVNNSWGASPPSNDPFLEDIQQAWADSGIFGVWSNGNDGERGCRSSGSPGSRIINYSVGAYTSGNIIAPFSGRGFGQDGAIKPNISAPGVDVRSSVPDGYALLSGTSMAAPHVAGSVALLWSKTPDLARDLVATRMLLDLTARDTEDLTCGGTAAKNNVYGEGRLDALALVQTGANGVGTLAGRASDAVTGQPVAGATVTADGARDQVTKTGSDGGYTLSVPAGEYQVRIGGVFGYRDHTATVAVPHGVTTRHDVALDQAARVPVTGTVRDGGGHGWTLYAKVVADDGAGHTFTAFTDPATGRYSLPVVENTAYTLRFDAIYPGYNQASKAVSVATGEATADADLPVAPTCAAPGYQVRNSGPTERFDQTRPPQRWNIDNVDPDYPGYDAKPGWVFTNPGDRTNNTGGTGNFAIVDSDNYGQHHVQNTTLTSPVIDMSGFTTPFVEFATDLRPAVNSTATVELSTDGRRTWHTVWESTGFSRPPGAALHTVPIPAAAGQARVAVRFHYTGQWSGWWQLDDVFIGNRSCDVAAGGLVVGTVTDTTAAGINGATVADADRTATTVATPDDNNLGDGLYWLFTESGDRTLTATAPDHAAGTASVTVVQDQASRLDLTLEPAR